MARPVTLFTGQWADLPLEVFAAKATSGDSTAWSSPAGATTSTCRARSTTPATAREQRELLEPHGLECWAISIHLVGQAVLRPDRRAPPGDPAARSGATATRRRAQARRGAHEGHRPRGRALRRRGRQRLHGLADLAPALLVPARDWRRSTRATSDFAERWNPILDVFDAEGVRFALEVHPTEIAYDFYTRAALDAIGHRPRLRLQLRPEPPGPAVRRPGRVHRRVPRPDLPRPRQGLRGHARRPRSILASHLNFGDPDRGWDFVSPGHGDVDFEAIVRALNRIGYDGPALGRVGRLGHGPRVRGGEPRVRPPHRLRPSSVAFDAAFARERLVGHAAQVAEPGRRRRERVERSRRRSAGRARSRSTSPVPCSRRRSTGSRSRRRPTISIRPGNGLGGSPEWSSTCP